MDAALVSDCQHARGGTTTQARAGAAAIGTGSASVRGHPVHRIAADPAATGELIELCTRLPLALGIAAARAAIRAGLPLAETAAELRDAGRRLDVLDVGDAATSVRTVFSWSYQKLSEPAARMFRLLGVHPGPDISAPAAASMADLAVADASRLLAELTRAHLVNEHATGRFAFHDLLRTYAAELSVTEDRAADLEAAKRRMLDHYLHTADVAALALNPKAILAPRPALTGGPTAGLAGTTKQTRT